MTRLISRSNVEALKQSSQIVELNPTYLLLVKLKPGTYHLVS